MPQLINKGSVDDIRSSLKHCEHKLSIGELIHEMVAEVNGQDRISVIKMLSAAIKRKNKTKKS